ncbi:MAG: class I SAM-dependent methyltransferase [Nitriliruptoraceae bacterium]
MTDDDSQSHAMLRAGYVGAVDHYTSPQRRDAVKRVWEEPELIRVLDTALRQAATPITTVVDVGCGTGVALQLLHATDTYRTEPLRRLKYVGLDLDEALLTIARASHEPKRDGEQVTFVVGDIRDGLPTATADLVVSSGVPFSHLTRSEFTDTLTCVFHASHSSQKSLVAVIDVLGRYSLEWVSMWNEERWSYRMSFFATDQQADATLMTTYDADALATCVATAAQAAGVTIVDSTMIDRSIMVGRHTMTGDYTPDLPAWRSLMNALNEREQRVDLDALRCTLDIPDAPKPIADFFATFISLWNDSIDQAAEALMQSDDATALTMLQPALFAALRALELSSQPGLGVGHSLTAVVVVQPTV